MITSARRIAVVAALVALVGPVAAVTSAAPACAAGETRVSVVVDFGDLPNPPATTSTCVAASDGDTGAEVLAARAKQLGRPAPRYNSSGLLCAIDGLPSTGCGERVGDGYRYWSYFHGSAAGWEYSSVGPIGARAKATHSEGWRFTDGTGRPGDPAPRGSADPAAVCRPQGAPATTSPPAAAAPGRSPTTPAGATARASGGTVATTAVGATTTSTTGLAPSETTSTTADIDAETEVAGSARSRPDDSGGGGRAVGTAAGAAAVLALVGGGVLAARRRGRA